MAEAVEHSGRREGLDLGRGEPSTPYEVGHVDVRAVEVPLLDDLLGVRGPDRLHPGQPEPDREGAVTTMLRTGIRGVGIEGADRRLRIGQARVQPGRSGGLTVDEVLELGVHAGQLQVGAAYVDAMPLRVGDQRLR